MLRSVLIAAAVVGAAFSLAAPAAAGEFRIDDVRAYLFLEKAGKLSDNVAGGAPMVNLPRGGGPGGDSASGVFIDFIFAGDKNSAPKFATASIDVSQTGKSGFPVVTHKAFANFAFGADGATHKALFLENVTCMTLEISVHAGKSSKDAKLVFQCP